MIGKGNQSTLRKPVPMPLCPPENTHDLTKAQSRAAVVGSRLARSQFASRRSCDQPTQSRFVMVFLGPRANAELVLKFHVALHASHVALPIETLKISPLM
jgi:hypothetical protein